MFSTPGGENCTASIRLPPGQLVHVQVFRGDPSRWFTTDDLATLWNVQRRTVYLWLRLARRGGHAPSPVQIRRGQRNAMRRWIEIRADYANVIEAIFKGKILTLK